MFEFACLSRCSPTAWRAKFLLVCIIFSETLQGDMKPGQPTTYDDVTGSDKAAMQALPVATFHLLLGCLPPPSSPLLPPPPRRRALAQMHADEKNGSDPIIFARAGTHCICFRHFYDVMLM
jgi:hypothetical protein